MLKSAVKLVLVLVFTALVACFAAWGSYTVTKNVMERKMASAISAEPIVIGQAAEPDREASDDEPAQFEYYTVRLEGEALAVYASHGGREEFLYNEKIYKNNLSPEDISLLSSGVHLKSARELTGFLENYTS